MAAESDIFEIYKKLTDVEKTNALVRILTDDKKSIQNIIRDNIPIIQELICSEDVIICYGHVGCVSKEVQYICAGCHKQYCITCMYNTCDNNKIAGWYCCRNEKCQDLYDKDEKL